MFYSPTQLIYTVSLFFLCTAVSGLTTGDGNFDYVINPDGISVKITAGRSSTIPASIDALPVTIIGTNAFKNTDLWFGATLTIPSNVIEIQSSAFYSIRARHVIIPNSVKKISSSAFRDCEQLETVTGGNNVESFGSAVFYKCRRLKSLYIGSKCTSISSQLIEACHALETLTVSSSNPNYAAIGTVLFNKDYTVLLAAPSTSGHYIIPDTVSTIDKYAFQNQNYSDPNYIGLTGVTIPSSVLTIGDGAFSNQNLTTVTVPSSVTSIGNLVFRSNDSLISAEINSAVIGTSMFEHCDNLSSVTINSEVTRIGPSAFKTCPNLTSVTIPQSVTTISSSAFSGCSLNSLTLPSNLVSIGWDAFRGCDFSNMIIPQSVTGIGGSAFAECFNLMTYTFQGINAPTLGPNALIPVEPEAEITYPYGGYGYGETFGGLPASSPYTSGTYDSFTYVINQDGSSVKITDYPNRSGLLIIPSSINGRNVTIIDDNAFQACSILTGVSIPDTVTSIGTAAFYGCSGLSTITIGSGVNSIGAYAFQGCSDLQNFVIHEDNNSLQAIGAVLFNNDLTGLIAGPSVSGSYEVPSSVTAIGAFAFQSNSTITAVTITPNVTSVGVNAFYGCSNLDDIKFLGTTAPALGANAFAAVSSGAAIIYPYGASGYGATFGGLPSSEIAGWVVSVGATSGGATNLAPGAGFEDGTLVSITAIPDLGYIFGNWSGDYSGISNPLEFTIGQDTSVTPLFYPDYSDADSDGLPAYDELITHGTNPNLPDSNADGVNDGDAVNAGLSPQTDYTDIITYVKSNSHDFDLYTSATAQAELIDLRTGSTMLNINGSNAEMQLQIQRSDDLSTWTSSAGDIITVVLPMQVGKGFYRFAMPQE